MTPPPAPPAKQPWWQLVAIDAGKAAALLLVLDGALGTALTGLKVPAGDLAIVTAVGVGLTALVSGLVNFIGTGRSKS
jgi:hypothetical protein